MVACRVGQEGHMTGREWERKWWVYALRLEKVFVHVGHVQSMVADGDDAVPGTEVIEVPGESVEVDERSSTSDACMLSSSPSASVNMLSRLWLSKLPEVSIELLHAPGPAKK